MDRLTETKLDRRSLSRRQLVLLGGGAAASAAVLAACGSDSSADSGETAEFGDGDVGILNFALTLEYLQEAFYADAVASGLFKKSDLALMRKFGEEEKKHIEELGAAVERKEGEPVEKPATRFQLEDPKQALEVGAKIEALVADGYQGQVPNLESESVLEIFLSVFSVESRHAAAFDVLLNRPSTPDGAFAKPASAKSVLAELEPFMAA